MGCALLEVLDGRNIFHVEKDARAPNQGVSEEPFHRYLEVLEDDMG